MSNKLTKIRSDNLSIDKIQTVGTGPLTELLGYSNSSFINVKDANNIFELNIPSPNGELRIGQKFSVPVSDDTNNQYFTIDNGIDSQTFPVNVYNTLDKTTVAVTAKSTYEATFEYLTVPPAPNDYFDYYYIGGHNRTYNFPSTVAIGNGVPHNNLVSFPDGIMSIVNTDCTFSTIVNSENLIPVRAYLVITLYDVSKYLYSSVSDTTSINIRCTNTDILGTSQGNTYVDYSIDVTQNIHRIPIESLIRQDLITNTITITCVDTDANAAVFIDDISVEIYHSDIVSIPTEYRYASSDDNGDLYFRSVIDINDILDDIPSTIVDIPTDIKKTLIPLPHGSYVSKVIVSNNGVFQYYYTPEDIIQVWKYDANDVSNENNVIGTGQRLVYTRADFATNDDATLLDTIYVDTNIDGTQYIDTSRLDSVFNILQGTYRQYLRFEKFSSYIVHKIMLPFTSSIDGSKIVLTPIEDGKHEIIYAKSLVDGRIR